MASLQSSYTLSPQQLEAALAALARAADTFRLSPLERRLHRALGICARIVTVAFVVTLLAIGLVLLTYTSPSDTTIAGYGCIAAPVAFVIGIGAGAAAILLLALNFRLVRKVVGQRRLLRQLGLQDVSYSAWKAHRKRRLWIKIGGAAMTAISVVLLIVGTYVAMPTNIATPTKTFELTNVLAGAFILLIGGTILAWQSLQHSQERLALVADADRLRATLTSLETDREASVVVPAAVLEKVAVIEHAQIARERAHAVLSGVSTAHRGYGVVVPRHVSEQKASLPPDRRLEVEELIEELVAEPHSSAAPGDDGDRVLSVHTPDGSAEIDYSVDERHRRIHIVALRARAVESGEPAHDSHAP
jgi:hypothetical protein